MVTRKKTAVKSKRVSAERRRVLERQAKLRESAAYAEKKADAAYAYAKKNATKENYNKAVAASKKVTTSLINYFKKKKAVPQRTTMSMTRK